MPGLDMAAPAGRTSSSGHRVVETGVTGGGLLGAPGLPPAGRGLSSGSMRGLLPPLAPGGPGGYGGAAGGAHMDRMASSEVRAVQALSGLLGDGTDPSAGLYAGAGAYGVAQGMGGLGRPPLSVGVGSPYMPGPPSGGKGLSPASAGGLSRLASSEVRAVQALSGLDAAAGGAFGSPGGLPGAGVWGTYGAPQLGAPGLALPPGAPAGGMDDATEAALLARVLGVGGDAAGAAAAGAGGGDDVHHVLQSLFGEDIARELATGADTGAGAAAAQAPEAGAAAAAPDAAGGFSAALAEPVAAVVKAEPGAPELAGDAELASEVGFAWACGGGGMDPQRDARGTAALGVPAHLSPAVPDPNPKPAAPRPSHPRPRPPGGRGDGRRAGRPRRRPRARASARARSTRAAARGGRVSARRAGPSRPPAA
jgi:collagen type III alpha